MWCWPLIFFLLGIVQRVLPLWTGDLSLHGLSLTLHNHLAQEPLPQAIISKLGITAGDLLETSVFKRGYDARNNKDIQLIYTVDVSVNHEEKLLEKFSADQQVRVTPDMSYKFVAQAPENLANRPVVVGLGPCGIFAALILAQMGLEPCF